MMVQQTSIDAFHEIETSLGKRQRLVYYIIKALGKPTNTEISKELGIPINQITPRTNELVKKGYVIQQPKRLCSITNRTALTWSVKEE